MPTSAPTNAAQQLTFQGLVVPGSALNPQEFFRRTRRQTILYKTISTWAGFGETDVVGILRSGVLSFLTVKISGSLVVTIVDAAATTPSAKWPYGLVRAARFQANGQSNLVNADGWFLKLREVMRKEALDDRGVAETVDSVDITQGSLAMASESWGPMPLTPIAATTTYDVELSIEIPVCYEQKLLTGAIFLQTTSTTCELDLDWANLGDLFTVGAGGSVAWSGNGPTISIEAEAFTIPKDGQGGFYLPNLSNFHSFIQTRFNGQVTAGQNEITLSGQGVGRKLMSVAWRTWPDSPATVLPIKPTAANILQPYWRYGTNETPEQWVDGQSLRYENERNYNSDVGAVWGFEAIDFDKIFAFRDSVDEGSATEIRFGYSITGAPTLTAPFLEYAQDVLLAGASA
jgi:hypothetical protein